MKKLEKEEMHDLLNECLNGRENMIITKRFGMDGEEKQTLAQLGESLDLSRERIRQIERNALRKMKKRPGSLPDNLPDCNPLRKKGFSRFGDLQPSLSPICGIIFSVRIKSTLGGGTVDMGVEELKARLRALLYQRDMLRFERDSLELFDLLEEIDQEIEELHQKIRMTV